ncbi:RHS repeat-associated core domain-containing protein [Flavobacterium cerinum]|uniref:RHS repeat-associated core domain-containing protein n=2 Tax=Flavobacterium cerinum TaxID=2502784 RepID=A0ABY5J0U8_9FLAO|nr:RHS repeat-associated core domain-containing protein [Flavobacterium cerinum]
MPYQFFLNLPFGETMVEMHSFTENYASPYKFNGKELDEETGLYYYGVRYYDPRTNIWLSVDPLAEQFPNWNPYNYTMQNPINLIDPTGMSAEDNDDWVLGSDNKIRWDNNANSPETTQKGDTYLGKTLTFNFNSYIDGELWDGPGGNMAAGEKLTSTVTITGNENEKGELTSISSSKSIQIGDTPIGAARDFYPGKGGDNNTLTAKSTASGVNINFEQHASVSPIEEVGLNAGGYKIVDVAQKLNINYNNKNGVLNVDAYTGIFPSASLNMSSNNGFVNVKMMQYNQPSFVKTHSANYKPVPVSGGRAYNFSYYPTTFYKR